MSRTSWLSPAALACCLAGMLTGCLHSDENHLGVTAAAGAGHVTTMRPVTEWRRKPLSLRLLGLVLDQQVDSQIGESRRRLSPAVVNWAARGMGPDGVAEPTDLVDLEAMLLGNLSPTAQSPAGHATSGH